MANGPPPAAGERGERTVGAVLDLEQLGHLIRLGPEGLRPLAEAYASGARQQIEAISAAAALRALVGGEAGTGDSI